MTKIKKIIVTLLFILHTGLFSYEVVLNFEPGEEAGNKVLAIIPFTSASMVNNELTKEINDIFVKKFVKDNKFKVRSVSLWLDEKYGSEAFSSVNRMLSSFKRGRMPVDKLLWGHITYLENECLFTLYWYDIKSRNKSMYQRIIPVKKGKMPKSDLIEEITDSILLEMDSRNEKENRTFSKDVLIKKTRIKYFNYTKLSTGLEEFTEIPIIQYRDTPMLKGEDFFSNLFEYNFYKTGVVREHSDMLGSYLKSDTSLLQDFSYVVESELRVSNNFSILKVIVKNPKWPPNDNTLLEYTYPLKEVTYRVLSEAAQKNSQLILLNLLNESELKKVGIVNLKESTGWVGADKKAKKRKKRKGSLYINSIYNGDAASIDNVILPFGENVVNENEEIFRVFVSPYWLSSTYFSVTDSLLMEKN